MVLYYIAYALVGKIFMYLIRLFPLTDKLIGKSVVLRKLIDCDLCLGVWIYFFLAMVMRENIFSFIPNPFGATWYLIEYFMTGAVTSFIMDLVSIGWNDKFRVLEIK